jgi:hypothetical protein
MTMNRTQYLLGSATHATQIIEIGAGYAPIAPKSDGWRTHVVDHCTQPELRTKYSDADVDINAIEAVDSVWQGGRLEASLPPDLVGQVDMMIASHVLEHIPDLVGFLQSASLVVRRGGSLAVALPDRRYCFDCFKPWTTTGDLLESHHHRLERHSLRTRYNRWAYSATTKGQLAWAPGPIELPTLLDPFQAAIDNAAAFRSGDGPYEDCHAWHFSPAGFRLCMLELRQMGLTDWIVDSLQPQEHFEFLTRLRRADSAPPPPATIQSERQSLLVEQLLEVHEQTGYLLRAAGRTEASAAPRLPDVVGVSGEPATPKSASARVALLETVLVKARRAPRALQRWTR